MPNVHLTFVIAGERFCGAFLGRNVDVFDLAARGRDWKAVCFETFKMKLDGFVHIALHFCPRCAC